MSIRFRLSNTAFAQQQQLKVPLALIEYLAQPAWRGAASILSARTMAHMPAALRALAQPFLGLYVTADGQGCVTKIGRLTHRLAHAAQADQYGLQLSNGTKVQPSEIVWRTPIGA
jgi:hypothetical protein